MANLPNQNQKQVPSLIEIGNFVLIARVLPQECGWYWMGKQKPGPLAAYQRRLTWPNVADLRSKLNSESTRLAFVHVPIRPKRFFDQGLLRMLHGDFGWFGFREAIAATRCPLVGLDFNDATEMSDTAMRILERSVCFFKRELPTDIARLLPRNASTALKLCLERNAHKLLPISLGLSASRVADLPQPSDEKLHDVFFSGDTSSVVRKGEFKLLEKLKAAGVRVFQPRTRLTQQEFLKTCSQSYLVWSPEGAGWDCFRHYEAAASGSIPVMNVPPITPYQPLAHDRHAIYYVSEFGHRSAPARDFQAVSDGFVATVMRALEDRPRLLRMGKAAREFALSFHTHDAIVNHIVRTSESHVSDGK